MAMTWARRIARAKKAGWFTGDDKNRADNWTKCALGEQTRRFVRRGKPVVVFDLTVLRGNEGSDDELLDQWGGEFGAAVSMDNIDLAEALYKKIKARTECLVDLAKEAAQVTKAEDRIRRKIEKC